MRYNTVIIGGGLSGLICGIRLAGKGHKCAIISLGQSAVHFSSGSFDLLNETSDEEIVTDPIASISRLAETNPEHPYSKIGSSLCEKYCTDTKDILEQAGIHTRGTHRRNHFRITPMGIRKPAWLTLEGYLTSDSPKGFEWTDAVIFNIQGFLDFHPEFLAESFRSEGIHCVCHEINIPDVDIIRKNPSEMRSANIARIFDKPGNISMVADIIREKSGNCNDIILPAVTGINNSSTLDTLRNLTGKNIYLVPTLPPSVPGIQVQQRLQHRFRELGGEYFLGDTVLKVERKENIEIYTYNHGDIPFTAENAVIATGSFFSKGLIATPDKIYEPVMDLDTEFTSGRENWYDLNFFADQQYQSFGIRTDSGFRAIKNGKILPDIYVAGAGLSGFNPIRQGCGGGVSMLTALYVADQILSK